ncbi:hypothetical protein HPB52_006581 [Rhipicephalus sanguineus]|uniref:Uncharacterized protein n=1 Tax=Rhipicephalus sanguineus TaxID=34632 RepID=A0A9D4PJ78_RHISA|nr:hypothetical protein HPB52_006581 [Rhipicephalus sanguineus]
MRGRPPRILPVQMILVAVERAEEDITDQGHKWEHVRKLSLLLLPSKPSCVLRPTAGGTYRDNLRHLFSTALRHIVELNVSSFHFGPDLDFGELLLDGTLMQLHSLSASLYGLRRPSALHRLAESCPEFKHLDVRIPWRCGDGVVRLSLTGVQDTAWVSWFIESCRPTATVRLCNTPSLPDCSTLNQALVNRNAPRALVLSHDHLQLGNTSVLVRRPSNIVSLQYLYLLSDVPHPEGVVLQSVRALHSSLPRLLCLHVHYRESPDAPDACSTATFAGLAKPLYLDVQPLL